MRSPRSILWLLVALSVTLGTLPSRGTPLRSDEPRPGEIGTTPANALDPAAVARAVREHHRQTSLGIAPLDAASALLEDGAWSRVPLPPAAWHSALYDPAGDRMVVFGGEFVPFFRHSEVWTLALSGPPVWTHLETAGTPPPERSAHSVIHDSSRNRMIVFGGYLKNDVWALDLSGTPTWTEIVPSGTPPAPRYDHSAVYDPVHDRMIVFGGFDATDAAFGDVWALTFSPAPTWTQLHPAGASPAPRGGHVAVYDPARARMLTFGGYDWNDYGMDPGTWSLALGDDPEWTELHPTGAPAIGYREMAVLDAPRDRILMWKFVYPEGDLWSLALEGEGTWSSHAVSGTGHPTSLGYSLLMDPLRDRVVVYGGASSTGLDYGRFWNVVSTVSLGSLTSTTVQAAGLGPSARTDAAGVFDSRRDRLLLLGGESLESEFDVWAFTPDATAPWSRLAISGDPPSPRWAHTAVYDSIGDRVLVLGGRGYPAPDDAVWALSLSPAPSWSRLVVPGPSPGARYGHSAILDPVRRRMIVFGGFLDQEPYRPDDTWSLDLVTMTWSPIDAPGARPSARHDHSAIYDPGGDRMIVFAGNPEWAFYNNFPLQDVWSLSLGGSPLWTRLAETAAGGPRSGHVAVHDARRGRMLVHGGHRAFQRIGSTYALDLTGSPVWSRLTTTSTGPAPRDGQVAILDVERDRMVVFGGWFGGHAADYYLNDTWFLALGSNRPPDCSGAAPSIAELWPANRRMVEASILGVTDPDGDPVTLRVTDVRQDEPVTSGEPDATGVGTDRVSLRAARDGAGDGRIYRIAFEASDGRGGTCAGVVEVCAPHDRGRASCVPGEAWYASTAAATRGRGVLANEDLAGGARLVNGNGGATLQWTQRREAPVELAIHDLQGRKLRRLVAGVLPAGEHEAAWNGRDDAGARLAPGLYFYRLRVDGDVAGGRWLLTR